MSVSKKVRHNARSPKGTLLIAGGGEAPPPDPNPERVDPERVAVSLDILLGPLQGPAGGGGVPWVARGATHGY